MGARRASSPSRALPALLASSWLACAAAAAVAACNAISGAGDLTTNGALDDAASALDDAASAPDGAPPGDDGGDGDALGVDANAPPSYCQGVVLYARFDGTFATAEGEAAELPPSASFAAGKYGQAVLLTGTAAGAIFYPTGDAGGPPYPRTTGSVATWLKPTWTWPSQAATRILWKPVIDRSGTNNSAAPYVRDDVGPPGDFGVANLGPDGGMTTAFFVPSTITGSWHDLDWNYVVATWTQTPGALGVNVNGGSAISTTTSAWDNQFAGVPYFRVGSDVDPPDAYYDDVAVWSRVLTKAEIGALYASPVSLGDACGL